MSKTQAVSYGGRTLWAFDAALAVWLAEVIDTTCRHSLDSDPRWQGRLENWRRVASLDAIGLDLDADWETSEIATFVALATEANESLRARGSLTGPEVASRRLLDDTPTNAERYRADETVDTEPIAVLGVAIIDLVTGRLPQPRAGTWWGFGFEREPVFIPVQPGAPPG